MPIVNGYATLPELKAWIGEELTDLDPVLEQQINAASRWIDGKCRRRFYQETGPRVFDATNCYELVIDDARTVTSVATDDDGDGDYETAWAAGDFQAVPPAPGPEARPIRCIRAVAGRTFPRSYPGGRSHLVEVTANWGWETLPDAIHEACLIQAARLLKRRNSPEGITGFGNEFGHIRVTNRDDPDALSQLAPYILQLVA